MKLGLHLYDFSWPAGASQLGPTLVQIAQAAEAAGFDRIGTVDHVWQSHYLGGPAHEVPSCYPTLTYLAAHTSQIKLIALATASPYWHPVLLAKTVTTLDVVYNWVVVCFSNFLGAIFLAWLVFLSGHTGNDGGAVARTYLRIAAAKTSLPPLTAFASGVMCNVLVCTAV